MWLGAGAMAPECLDSNPGAALGPFRILVQSAYLPLPPLLACKMGII